MMPSARSTSGPRKGDAMVKLTKQGVRDLNPPGRKRSNKKRIECPTCGGSGTVAIGGEILDIWWTDTVTCKTCAGTGQLEENHAKH